MPAIFDDVIYHGATYSRSITLTNPNGSVYDLDPWSIRATIYKKSLDDPTDTFTCSKDVPSGVITLVLTPQQTRLLDRTCEYKWLLEFFTGTAPNETDVVRMLSGVMVVEQ
jgi:hypothetical protein